MGKEFTQDIVLVIAGEAGQGLQAIEGIVSLLLKRSGYNVFSASEFMSRVRGGSNSTVIRVSSKPMAGYTDRIDVMLLLNPKALERLSNRISSDTIILADPSVAASGTAIPVEFSTISAEFGGAFYVSTVASGLLSGLFHIDEAHCLSYIREYFAAKGDDVKEKNCAAFSRGYAIGSGLAELRVSIPRDKAIEGEYLLSGADAVALGALAGGCDYVCGYPMSPATSVLEKMATFSQSHDIIVEQVEDEIGVVNMAIGAWYSGARALVSTSGGGFALMTEGVSLAGMIESPLVFHLAQRPGPATGLPTRTEQGDLNLVLYAGHGDFPRIVLAPGTLEEAYSLTRKAFMLADKFQVPVFILTDQFFVDSRRNTPLSGIELAVPPKHICETDAAYRRFRFTDTGISPRGVPGFGKGVVCADSDEHDESGHITENLDVRVKMVDKRNRKLESIRSDIIEPKLAGPPDYSALVICWGSTFATVMEAVRSLERQDVAVLHFSWVFPLSSAVGGYLAKARRLVMVENNYSAQFADLIALSTGIRVTNKILKYSGLPFSTEELAMELRGFLRDGAHNGT